MNSTLQHRGDERQTSNEQAPRAARGIYRLPMRTLLRLDNLASDEQSRGHIAAQVTEAAIDLRVDWDGNAASAGRFEVRVSATGWQACELIDPGDQNDVVSPSVAVASSVFLARFQRGPVYGSARFGVKALPIAWAQPAPTVLSSDYIAVRGKDYTYQAGVDPQAMPWTYSVLADGIQRLTLELVTGRDYEVWVRLQDAEERTEQVRDWLWQLLLARLEASTRLEGLLVGSATQPLIRDDALAHVLDLPVGNTRAGTAEDGTAVVMVQDADEAAMQEAVLDAIDQEMLHLGKAPRQIIVYRYAIDERQYRARRRFVYVIDPCHREDQDDRRTTVECHGRTTAQRAEQAQREHLHRQACRMEGQAKKYGVTSCEQSTRS